MLTEWSSHVGLKSSIFGHLLSLDPIVLAIHSLAFLLRGYVQMKELETKAHSFLLLMLEMTTFANLMIACQMVYSVLVISSGMERTVELKAPAVSLTLHHTFARLSLNIQLMLLK